MPPVTKAGGDAFQKEVSFTAKDDDEQKATGIVMVPDKADRQHDFAREDTIRAFADEFGALYDSESADGGIMHAAWPSEWMSLERNEVLDEPEDIGGQTVEAGSWVQTWAFEDAETWGLVQDGVYGGYSIGAKAVEWEGPYMAGEDDAVDDVDLADQLPDDAMVWELTDGVVREVSTVDIPAVPDAEILATKRLGDHLGDRDAFIEEAMQRGHSEADAERMWDNLSRALEAEGASDPGKESMLAKAGKAFLKALSPDSEPDVGGDADAKTAGNGSEGEDDEDPDDEDDDEQDDKNAPDGDTSDDSTDMSDDTDSDTEDAGKSLAEKNAEQINELTDAVKGLTETIEADDGGDADPDKTAEVELPDGSIAEVSKSEVEGWFEDDDGTAKADSGDGGVTKADIEALHARLDAITRESGGSQQLDGNSGTETTSKTDEVAAQLS